jgi:hypothetical protein
VRVKDFTIDAPIIVLLRQDEEVGVSGSTPVSGLKSGHSGISDILDCYDLSLERLRRPALFDDPAEFFDCPFDGLAAIGAGYSRSPRRQGALAQHRRFVLR